MGSTMTKEESAVVMLLQHILSMRGLNYDSSTLKALLSWAKGKDLIPTAGAVFDVSIWEKIGAELWDEISKGSREASKFSTVWRLINETLQSMKAERQAVASAFAALTPADGSASATSMLFQGPTIPAATPARAVGGVRIPAETVATAQATTHVPAPEGKAAEDFLPPDATQSESPRICDDADPPP